MEATWSRYVGEVGGELRITFPSYTLFFHSNTNQLATVGIQLQGAVVYLGYGR